MSKVEVDALVKLINLASCGGIIESISITNEDSGERNVKVIAMNDVNTLISVVEFDADIPEFCSADIQKTLSMLNTLKRDDIVDVSTKKGYLIIKRDKPKKILRITTVKESMVVKPKKVPKIDGDALVKIDTKLIRDIVSDSKAVDLSEIPMMVKDSDFYTVVGDLDTIENYFEDAEVSVADGENETCEINVKFHEQYISSIFKLLDGKVTIEIGNEKPLTITKETDLYKVSYILAPIISDDDEDYEEDEE